MATSPFSTVLRPEPDRDPLPDAAEIVLEDDGLGVSRDGNATVTELADGAAIVDLNPKSDKAASTGKFDSNLALEMEDSELSGIASELLEGIRNDDQSRQDWLTTHAEGIKLLGLVIEEANSNTDTSAFDGMSRVYHPLLLDACLFFQANARGELLPASGPVKVRDDRPAAPEAAPGMGDNGGPPLDAPMAAAPPPMGGPLPMPPGAGGAPALPPQMPEIPKPSRDALAEALEKDMNHYLTTTAQEYYPDTDRMLFSVGFGGQGVKKVYNCPLRRRPVSESVAMEDFIVSNALTDLGNAGRITHRIKMRKAVLKRMQLLKVYCDVDVGEPTASEQPNAVDQAKAEVVGVQPQPADPKDADYELYECYCELDLDQFAPPKFKGKQIALPYRVTIEKDSERVLEIRRNWKEADPECIAKEFFVEYPYVKAFGFYGIGLLHILGNTTKTLTAAFREMIDSGMFANFPGFVYDKGAGRQLTNQFRVPPGGGIGLDTGLKGIRDAVMPLPYKDLGPAFTAFIAHVEELGQRLGGTANINVGEGRQDAPVGTTLALIEQATKPLGAVQKRLHSAQSKELQLLKERFRDDPEAFWRFNRRPAMPWQKEQFVAALEDFDFVPVSDPNNPTHMHRVMKANAVQQVAMAAPGLIDPRKAWKRVAQAMDIEDPDDLLMPVQKPQQARPDPNKLAELMAKMTMAEKKQAADSAKARTQHEYKMLELAISAKNDDAERRSRERIAELQIVEQRLELAATLAIHTSEAEQAAAESAATLSVPETKSNSAPSRRP